MKLRLSVVVMLGSFLAVPTLMAKVAADPAATIKQMAGCFKVTFQYVEDGEHDEVFDSVYEVAELNLDDGISLSRKMIMNGTPIPHWSETWRDLGDDVWSQEVRGPGGDVRYQCQGAWVMNQWRCQADHAPKPRRDRTRTYSHLDRENTLVINSERWVHAQNNFKKNADDQLVSVEVGFNVYERVADSFCQFRKHSHHH